MQFAGWKCGVRVMPQFVRSPPDTLVTAKKCNTYFLLARPNGGIVGLYRVFWSVSRKNTPNFKIFLKNTLLNSNSKIAIWLVADVSFANVGKMKWTAQMGVFFTLFRKNTNSQLKFLHSDFQEIREVPFGRKFFIFRKIRWRNSGMIVDEPFLIIRIFYLNFAPVGFRFDSELEFGWEPLIAITLSIRKLTTVYHICCVQFMGELRHLLWFFEECISSHTQSLLHVVTAMFNLWEDYIICFGFLKSAYHHTLKAYYMLYLRCSIYGRTTSSVLAFWIVYIIKHFFGVQ